MVLTLRGTAGGRRSLIEIISVLSEKVRRTNATADDTQTLGPGTHSRSSHSIVHVQLLRLVLDMDHARMRVVDVASCWLVRVNDHFHCNFLCEGVSSSPPAWGLKQFFVFFSKVGSAFEWKPGWLLRRCSCW